jgi:hypothetical protein
MRTSTYVLVYEDLTEVVLVGAIYSEMVVTGVAERLVGRLRRVVHLDAFVVRDGESLARIVGEPAVGWVREVARAKGDGWHILHDPPDADRRADMLLKALETPVAVRGAAAAALPHSYIHCTLRGEDWPASVPREASQRARSAGWEYRELATGHYPPLCNPKEQAAVLWELSLGRRGTGLTSSTRSTDSSQGHPGDRGIHTSIFWRRNHGALQHLDRCARGR